MGNKHGIRKKNLRTFDGAPGILTNKAEVISVKRALDAYSNPPANLGIGANNLVQTSKYVMQRFTWDYYTLNILFRDNWIAKAIIEKPANEMMKNGFKIQTELDPDKIDEIMRVWTSTKTNKKFLQCLKWSRLYGGCLLIPMIEGQEDLSTPLDLDMVMPGNYKGCFNIDRWSGVSPSLELVDDISDPDFGQPEYYVVTSAPDNFSTKIHHSRVIKMIGRELPYWEEVAETYWGASELEHVYTELKKRDDTSANIAFLIFLANIRTYSMQDLGQAISMGDQEGLQRVYDTMRAMNQVMCSTGMLAIDQDDKFEEHQYTFTGINDVYESFMLDISGAAEIPIDKLFGRSPTGFNSGEETLQNYYDTIDEKRETYVRDPLEKLMKIITMSALGKIPDDMTIEFNPVRRSSENEQADLAQKYTGAILDAFNGGLVNRSTALKELKQSATLTNMWTNITDQMIEEAEKEDEQKAKEEEDNKNELESGLNDIIGGKTDVRTSERKEQKE